MLKPTCPQRGRREPVPREHSVHGQDRRYPNVTEKEDMDVDSGRQNQHSGTKSGI